MKLRWSKRALADLNRFAVFLQDRHPAMARRIGPEILKRAQLIADDPDLGRLIGQGAYRELSCPILGATYVFRYRRNGNDLLILRVFHSREQREHP